MAKLYNLARMSTATTGTGTITLFAAVPGFLSFAGAGVQDGDIVSYGISDGSSSEVGRGTYTSSGTTLSRDTVLASTNGGAKISLSGSAQVFITGLAQDLTAAFNTVVVQKFTASGTYTPTSGMKYCIVECVGGGGSGAGGTGVVGKDLEGGGGASGQYARRALTSAQVGASQAVTIGAGGVAPAAGNNNGNAGGNTSLGALVVANGGGGGFFASVGQLGLGGSPSGSAGTGDFVGPGAPGGSGTYANEATAFISTTGFGGSSIFGGGAPGPGQGGDPSTGAGANATGYGSGGSGGLMEDTASTVAGGSGSPGICIVTEFCNQ